MKVKPLQFRHGAPCEIRFSDYQPPVPREGEGGGSYMDKNVISSTDLAKNLSKVLIPFTAL
jgi:hypothetical protein